MRATFSAGDLLDAVLALRLQCVTAADAARLLCAPSAVGASSGSSLLDRLALVQKLSPSRRQAIETLHHNFVAELNGAPESCLEALGIDEPALLVLAEGAEAEVAELLESRAAGLDGSTPAAAEPSGSADAGDSTQPESPTIYVGDAHAFHSFARSGSAAESPIRFRKVRLHAKGGLGKVSIAEDEQFRRRVALKEIREKHADSPESRARFVREAEITGFLEHPGIVPVYALGHHPDGRPFYAMRLVRGTSMQKAIDRFHRQHAHKVSELATPDTTPPGKKAQLTANSAARPQSKGRHQRELRRLLRRFIDVCNTIQYAHSRGVIHRDLKPANIMLGKHGETLVVDWGLAKTLQGSDLPAEEPSRGGRFTPHGNTPPPTLTGRVIGTPGFMSPEQARGDIENLGPASDIFSLGAMLYCILTGRPPFAGATAEEQVEQMRAGDFPPPRELNRNVAPPLEAICRKALAWSPDDRYASAASLGEDLERWLADEPVHAWREPFVYRASRWMRRHRSWTLAGAAALLAVTLISLTATAFVNTARQRAATARHNEAVARERAELERQEAQRLAASLLVHEVEFRQRDRLPGWTWKGLEQLGSAVRLAPQAVDPVQARTLAAACIGSIDARRYEDYALSEIDHCVAFSPDSRVLAVAESKALWTEKAAITLIEIDTGRRRKLQYARDILGWELANRLPDGGRSLAFSRDGRWLLVGTRSGWIHRWDLHDERQPPVAWKPVEDDVEVHQLLFSPEGDSLYAVSRNARGAGAATVCTITRWGTNPWRNQPEAAQQVPGVVRVAWCSGTKRLLAGGKTAQWLDALTLKSLEPAGDENSRWPGGVGQVAASAPPGIVALETSNQLSLLDYRTGRVLTRLTDPRRSDAAHEGSLRAIDFGDQGRLLATGTNEEGVKIWSLTSGTVAARIDLPGSETTAPQFSPDGRWLASPADDCTVIYELRRSDAFETIALQPDAVEQFAYSPDGELLLTAVRPSAAELQLAAWSVEGRMNSWTIPTDPNSDAAPQLAWSPQGDVICISPPKEAYWVHPDCDDPPRPIPSLGASRRLAKWSPDGALLWTVANEGDVQVFTAPQPPSADFALLREFTTRRLALVTGRRTITCLATGGRWALAGLDNGMVMAMGSGAGDKADFWQAPGNYVHALAVTGDGRLAAAGTDRGAVAVYDCHTGHELTRLDAFSRHGVDSVALNRGGEWLVAASFGGAVRLWRRSKGKFELYAALREADDRRLDLQFHPTQPWIAARIAGDRALSVWRLDVLEEEFARLGLAR